MTGSREPSGTGSWHSLLALAVFVGFVSFLAMHHEMWRDEVRALTVAVDATSIPGLFASLRTEGHPALWYLVLMAGHAVTGSRLVLPLAAILLSTLAAAVILHRAPFPFYFRLLTVFGAFLAVEETVMARNYGIGILFMVAACAAFPSRTSRPVVPAVLLALLANTSVHGALASLVIGLVWLLDLIDPERRKSLLAPKGVAAFMVVLGGVAFGFWSAQPAPDISFAFSFATTDSREILRAILSDPGWGLSGYRVANVAAAGELPWERFGFHPEVASRWLVNLCLLAFAWSLRKTKRILFALIIAIAGFQVVFRVVYTGALRHEGIVAFLFVALGWIAIGESGFSRLATRRITLGLLPLIATQAAAMPFLARRIVRNPESSSKAYGAVIASTPRYRDAILAGEPDYMMEAMPYYVSNRVYMARQRALHTRVHFSATGARQLDMSLADLLRVTDSVAGAECRPVLLAIGYPAFRRSSSGVEPLGYKPAVFRWTPAEKALLGKPVFEFEGALRDENYSVYEVPPPATCGAAKP